VDYDSGLHEPRTNAEQSETDGDFRVSFESRAYRRFASARRGEIQPTDLYFILAGKSAVKIGRAVDVWKRIQNMQTNNHEELNCVLRLVGRGQEEPVWHRAFADYRVRGEWFDWSSEVQDAIQCAREGGDWWEHLLPPFDMLADATVEFLDDPEAFEAAYWKCVDDWRGELEAEIARLNAHPQPESL
jgi:hypothetical protein